MQLPSHSPKPQEPPCSWQPGREELPPPVPTIWHFCLQSTGPSTLGCLPTTWMEARHWRGLPGFCLPAVVTAYTHIHTHSHSQLCLSPGTATAGSGQPCLIYLICPNPTFPIIPAKQMSGGEARKQGSSHRGGSRTGGRKQGPGGQGDSK